jgi:hypothetical protein
MSKQPTQSPTETQAPTETGKGQRPGGGEAAAGSAAPSIWLVDGYNVLHTVLLGGQPRESIHWWSEAGRKLLCERVMEFDGLGFAPSPGPSPTPSPTSRPNSTSNPTLSPRPTPGTGPTGILVPRRPEPQPAPGSVWIVFDGKRPGPAPGETNPKIVFAPSADQWIVGQVRKAQDARAFAVVTADHQVGGRCRHAGAQVVAPRDFIARCGTPEP